MDKLNDFDAVQAYISKRQKDVTRFNEPTRGQTICREVYLLKRMLKMAVRQKPIPWVSHVAELEAKVNGHLETMGFSWK